MNLDNLSISEAEDSGINNPKSGDALVWDVITSKWVNAPSSPSETALSTTFYSRVATTTALATVTYNNGAGTLTKSTNGALANIDGIAMAVYDVILVKDQSAQLQNGLYEVTDLGSAGTPFVLTRLSSYDETAEIYPSQINVLEGVVNANKYFLQSTVNPTVGTSSIVYGSAPTPVTTTAQLAFVDTITSAVLPNTPTYTSGTSSASYPGYLATYVATTNGAFPTVNGVAPFVNMKILVKDQADATKNGDYVMLAIGSASTKWKLRRISYDVSQLYPRLWAVYQGTSKGLLYQQDTKTLTNLLIGITGSIVFTSGIQTQLDARVFKNAFPYHDSFVISDLTTAITAVVFDYKMMLKFAVTITSFVIDLQTAQTSGSILTFNILKNGVTVLSTLATIDNTEKSTLTSATPLVINTGSVSFIAGDILSVQCTQVGNGTAKCATITTIGTRAI